LKAQESKPARREKGTPRKKGARVIQTSHEKGNRCGERSKRPAWLEGTDELCKVKKEISEKKKKDTSLLVSMGWGKGP